jgi:hypothetical protein
MNFEQLRLNLPAWAVFLAALVAICSLIAVYYFEIDDSQIKIIGLVGGVLAGLVVYILTFLTILSPLKELDRFRRMGVKNLLMNRHDRDYYRDLVKDASRSVAVMGASCTRFVDDFLDEENDDKVLFDALSRQSGLQVRFLIPSEEFMTKDSNDRVVKMVPKISKISGHFNGRIQLRRFNESARHSFVLVDDELVAGPIFDNDRSKHAPAVHVSTTTPFGRKHEQYFEEIWNKSVPSF